MAVQDRIDLNQYAQVLTPYKSDRGCFHCPLCAGKLAISPVNGEKFVCITSDCSRYQIRVAVQKLAGEERSNYSEQFQQQLATRQAARDEAERDRVAALRSDSQRDRHWQEIVDRSFLSDGDRQAMLDRGYTPNQIVASKARSLGGGRVMPIHTANGLMVDSQVIKFSGKTWYGAAGTHHLRETGELPLAVVYPAIAKAGMICYTESVGDKPFLTAHRFRCATIGSSNIGSQPIDLARSISTIQQRYGWQDLNLVHIIMVDAGCLINLQVISNYLELAGQLDRLGGKVRFGWWGQFAKADGDIDEIAVDTHIELLSGAQFLSLFRSYLARMATIAIQHNAAVEKLAPKQFLHLLTF